MTESSPTVELTVTTSAPEAAWSSASEVHSDWASYDNAVPAIRYLRLSDRDVIRVQRSVDIHLLDDRIMCHLVEVDHDFLVEILLGGLAFSFWLERCGRLTLHGAACSIDGAGVGFLANGGVGKSSIVSFLTSAGEPLITEDLLVVGEGSDGSPTVQPGLQQLRLWPEQAARFTADWELLDQPHPRFSKRKVPVGPDGFGTAVSGPTPLRRLFVLKRQIIETGRPQIIPLSAARGVEVLLSHSYLPELSAKFGWHERRLGQIVDLLEHVEIAELWYPTGFQHLPVVRDLIRQTMSGT